MTKHHARFLAAAAFGVALHAGCGSSGDSPPVGPETRPGSSVAPNAPRGSSDGTSSPASTPLTAKGCVTAVTAGHQVFVCDGVRYDVEVSPACASGGCGLVLDVHGFTMDAEQQDRNTGLRARGAARGYVVVQPTAAGGLFGPSWLPESDDPKVWRFVEDAVAAYAIDKRRVHVTGFSQGGAMAWRFACKHADVIASAAPVADASGCRFEGTDTPTRKLSILSMAGVRDPFVPIHEARAKRTAALKWLGPATEEVVSTDAHHSRVRYRASAGSVLEFVEHEYVVPPSISLLANAVGGHCFPGSPDLEGSPEREIVFGCTPPNALVWGDVVMEFFAQNPMP